MYKAHDLAYVICEELKSFTLCTPNLQILRTLKVLSAHSDAFFISSAGGVAENLLWRKAANVFRVTASSSKHNNPSFLQVNQFISGAEAVVRHSTKNILLLESRVRQKYSVFIQLCKNSSVLIKFIRPVLGCVKCMQKRQIQPRIQKKQWLKLLMLILFWEGWGKQN